MPVPKSAPFKVDTENFKQVIVGMDAGRMRSFFDLVFHWCKIGKIYQITVKEMTASEVQNGYLFLCLSLAADELKMSDVQLRLFYQDNILQKAISGVDDNCRYEDWVVDIVDPNGGEIIKQVILPMSEWNVSMTSFFIDYFITTFKSTYPDFKFPDPDKFKGVRKGRKNEVLYLEERLVFR